MNERELLLKTIWLGRLVDHFDDLHKETRSGMALKKAKKFDAKRRDLQLTYQRRSEGEEQE